MKKLLSLIVAMAMFMGPMTTVSYALEEAPDEGFVQVEVTGTSPTVKVFENPETGEMYATFDTNHFEVGDDIILYNDSETGMQVGVKVVSTEPKPTTRASDDTGWGAGSIPSGYHTLEPHIDYWGVSISYMLDVSAYPVVFEDAYNDVISGPVLTIEEADLYIRQAEPNSSADPASAILDFQLTIEQCGVVAESTTGYLEYMMNPDGNARMRWAWNL